MGAEENKQRAMRFYDEVFNAGDMSVIDDIIHDNYVDHEAFADLPNDKAGMPIWIEMMKSAFPDMKMTVVSMMATEDEVWAHVRATGTHKGSFMGLPPTENKFDIEAFDRVRVVDGKAIEHWGVTDVAALMQQIGFAPLPD
jgi:steroid delta-isomerase-like uncharacterized protein